MTKVAPMLVCLMLLVLCSAASAQNVQVDRANKTIQVTTTHSVSVSPEIAELQFGYKNHAATQESAIETNVRVANKITKALLDSGVPKEAIETSSIRVDRTRDLEYRNRTSPAEEFTAKQDWTVRCPISQADRVLELAIRSGANVVEPVNWTVRKPEELTAKAIEEALARTRALAEQMAKQTGNKLGELLYLSNMEPEDITARVRRGMGGAAFAMALPPPPPPLPIHLFPARVERSATVTVVFALD